MPINVVFENDGTGVVVTAEGDLAEGEIFRSNQSLYTPAIMARLRYEIVDLSRVDSVQTSPERIRALAEQDRAASLHIPNLKIAIVAKNELMRTFGRMWQSYLKADDLDAEVFSTMQAARVWIARMLQVHE